MVVCKEDGATGKGRDVRRRWGLEEGRLEVMNVLVQGGSSDGLEDGIWCAVRNEG